MTPEHIKFGFSLAGGWFVLAGICFMVLKLPEIFRTRKLDIADLSTEQKDIMVLTRRVK